jgi:D-3-phosphoglycerate dehydrogenase
VRILISDHPDSMMPDHALEIETLRAGLGPDTAVDVLPYREDEHEAFLKALRDADALLTAFVTIDDAVMAQAPDLKVISLNSTGYDCVDLEAATRRGIGVCPVGEYCTSDVAEAAVAFVFALHKRLKAYGRRIDNDHVWDFAALEARPRLQDQTLGIFGFGKIGRCIARKLSGLVGEVIVCDPYVGAEAASAGGARLVEKGELLASSDVIVNSMLLTAGTQRYFDEEAFAAMARRPDFVNMSRGMVVDEDALLGALESGRIRGYAADVLADETPDLARHPLVGREDVLLTPHSAFYSSTAMESLERLSCENIVHFLRGEKDRVFKLVN